MQGQLADNVKPDSMYLEMRRKELLRYREVFGRQLGYVLERMPAPTIRVNLQTGEHENIYDPKWEALIDKIKKHHMVYLEQEFPEFFPPTTY